MNKQKTVMALTLTLIIVISIFPLEPCGAKNSTSDCNMAIGKDLCPTCNGDDIRLHPRRFKPKDWLCLKIESSGHPTIRLEGPADKPGKRILRQRKMVPSEFAQKESSNSALSELTLDEAVDLFGNYEQASGAKRFCFKAWQNQRWVDYQVDFDFTKTGVRAYRIFGPGISQDSWQMVSN